MDYDTILKRVARFSVIVVSGPQRSGTTFAAKCLAKDMNYRYVDESEFDVDNESKFAAIVSCEAGAVIQAPGCSAYLVNQCNSASVFVVFMMRPTDEIKASQDRIGWTDDEYEYSKYFTGSKLGSQSIARFKQKYWLSTQARCISNSCELMYYDLRNHRDWVSKEDRIKFDKKQTII